MATRRVPAAGRGQPGELAAVGCWGGCWVSGCWGGCWPGVKGEREMVEQLARALGGVKGAPAGMEELFRAAASGVKEQGKR